VGGSRLAGYGNHHGWARTAIVAAAVVIAPVISLASGQAIAGLVIDGAVLIGVAASWPRPWAMSR
jgi:hypothetical protein